MPIGKKTIVNAKHTGTKEKSSGVRIERDSESIHITIPLSIARSAPAYDISRLVIAAISPVFLNEGRNMPPEPSARQQSPISLSSIQPSFTRKIKGERWLDVGIMMESVAHYTGGRYYVAMLASVLSHYCKVTLYTNREPIFPDGLIDKFSSIRVVVTSDMGMKNKENDHDIVIGSPANGGRIAKEYADKWGIPHYQIIFETPNWISSMREGDDGTEVYWRGYKSVLATAERVICISHEAAKWTQEWAGITMSKISVIYPSINTPIAEKYTRQPKQKNDKTVIICSHRLVAFKNPVGIIKKLDPKKFKFWIIGKSTELSNLGLSQMREKGFDITLFKNISDDQKFSLIRQADILLFPTEFEGFGIPPAEAMFLGTAVFTYDIPVLKEVYGEYNGIKFIQKGDVVGMIHALTQEAQDGVVAAQADSNTGVLRAPCSITRFKDDILRTLNIPKLTAGVIAYNADDYIGYAIESVMGVCDQVIVVDGAVRGYVDSKKPGRSSDGTIDIVQRIASQDVLGRIELVEIPAGRRVWEDKVEMQNEIVKRMRGDVYVKVDADEIWKPELLVDAVRMLLEKGLDIIKMPFLHFWLNFRTVAVDDGGKWSTCPPRIWRWYAGMKHTVSFNYFMDKNGKKFAAPQYRELVYDHSGEGIYHFGYVRKLHILQGKIRYYKNRGIEKVAKDTVTTWKNGMDTQPTQDAPSTSAPFTGVLPEILERHPYKDIVDIRSES